MKSAIGEHPGPAIYFDEHDPVKCGVDPGWISEHRCPKGHGHVERRLLGGGAYYLECIICWIRSGTLMDNQNVPKTNGFWDLAD